MQLRSIMSANTFDGVVRLYEVKAHALRRPPIADARSISPHRKPYVTVRPVHQGFALRYHDTDVVTWTRAQGLDSFSVRGWSSLSTETFADALTPWNVRFILHYDDGYFAKVTTSRAAGGEERVYEFGSEITFNYDPDTHMAVVAPGQNLRTKFIDMKSAMLGLSLKKTRYAEFMDYARARLALHGGPITQAMLKDRVGPHYRVDVVSLLADANKWEDFLFSADFSAPRTTFSHEAWLDEVGRFLRDRIYEHFKCVPVREVEWFPWSQFQNQLRLRNKYSWAVY